MKRHDLTRPEIRRAVAIGWADGIRASKQAYPERWIGQENVIPWPEKLCKNTAATKA